MMIIRIIFKNMLVKSNLLFSNNSTFLMQPESTCSCLHLSENWNRWQPNWRRWRLLAKCKRGISNLSFTQLCVCVCSAKTGHWHARLLLRSVHTTPQLRCVAALHRPAQKLRSNDALRCRIKVNLILTLNALMLRWHGVESNWYIGTATQLQWFCALQHHWHHCVGVLHP